MKRWTIEFVGGPLDGVIDVIREPYVGHDTFESPPDEYRLPGHTARVENNPGRAYEVVYARRRDEPPRQMGSGSLWLYHFLCYDTRAGRSNDDEEPRGAGSADRRKYDVDLDQC